ncbi:helix-turn-helix transcriptional regulator [Dyella telluris]|uniref:Addiction module antidote protein, HigA family n=1 Tax=Dyella telluris TaxID=2763498 RepID=A0A7G8Q094_9GAMM|nr:hypothetical protein [Dyella telluris]QNK00202.1 hypothetical protein H8F01_13880 [Dyella telluris]
MMLLSIHPQLRIDDDVPLRAPATVLQLDHMIPEALTVAQLARRSGIPAWHLHRLLTGQPLYAEEAFRLAAALHTSPLYWLMLQARHDLEKFRRESMPGGLGVHST